MKKLIAMLLLLCMLVPTFAACGGGEKEKEPSKITLDKYEATLSKGQLVVLTATVDPSIADKTLVWESDNTDVAIVNNGTVSAILEGTANITVKTEDGLDSATCVVKVVPYAAGDNTEEDDDGSFIPNIGNGSNIENGSGEVEEDKTPGLTLDAETALGIEQNTVLKTVFNSFEGDKLTYTSSDPEVVTIDATTGAMYGVKEGTATITVTNSNGEYTATTEVTVTDPLKGSIAGFCGDSICAASTYDKEHQWWGWAGRISKAYGLRAYYNRGADGASVSDCRGANTIVNQVKNLKNTPLDFLVLHGGVNDGWDKIAVGTISKDYNLNSFDVSTFAGGLENLFYNAKKLFPNAHICYIINFRMNTSVGSLRDMSSYYKVAKAICKKWNIPYLDLYDDAEFNAAFNWKTNKYLPDQIHPNSEGYEVIYPFIARFMRQVAYGIKVTDLK